jgi:signal transduction histidine kinase
LISEDQIHGQNKFNRTSITDGDGVKDPFTFWRTLPHRINVKLTLIFLLVGLVAPTIGIGYFYLVAISLIPQNTEFFAQQQTLLDGAAFLIILLIAVNTMILGLYISRSFTKPLQEFLRATQELEKGNFSVRANIKTNDELALLSDAFNKSASALEKMEEERQQLDKAKSEFLSIVSHELRTPITPLKAQLQMLQQEYFGKLTEKQEQSLTVILRNAERLNKIIEDFLEVSRIEAARLKFVFKQVSPLELIQETVRFMEGFAKEKNISLVVGTEQLPDIEADPDRISQVLRNLIHNAIKFSPQNSTIEIHANLQKDHLRFGVQDQGVGLTPEDQIRVFEPFYQVAGTLSRNYGGTGLGLTICRGIIEAQKGKIWVESKPEQGCSFYFTVPLKPIIDIEPIKVLFSSKSAIEKNLQKEFMVALGPMGIVEYNELKNKHALGKQDLLDYITSLEDQSILRHAPAQAFKKNIGKIFGEDEMREEKEKIHEEKNIERSVTQ